MSNIRKTTLAFVLCAVSFHYVDAQITFSTGYVTDPFTRAAGMCTHDFDGDGDSDLVAGSGTKGLFLFLNDGNAPLTWSVQTIDSGLKGCLSVVPADIDGDLLTDLVTGSWDDNTVVWYSLELDGTWSRKVIDDNFGQVHEIYVADIDQDGELDVLAAGMKTGEMAWYKNQEGGRTWSREIVASGYSGARSITAFDADGDGDMDIAGASFDLNDISIWYNLGGQPITWLRKSLTSAFRGAHFVEFADINGDGKQDLLASGYYANLIAWWENNGIDPAIWPQRTVDASITKPLVSRTTDVDMDGDPDIIATGTPKNGVVWYENVSANGSSWNKHVIDSTINGSWQVIATDLDGDFDPDLLAGADRGNQVRYYTNVPHGRFSFIPKIDSIGYRCAVSLPIDYDENRQSELLLCMHGGGHPIMYSVLRDYLLPVSSSRNCIIVSPDFPLASEPDFRFRNPELIGKAVEYFGKRFRVDVEKIYLMGGGCQGMETLFECCQPGSDINGAVVINPRIADPASLITLSPTCPFAGFMGGTNPDYYAFQQIGSAFAKRNVPSVIWPAELPDGEYLTDSLADFVLQGMNFLDTCRIVSGIGEVPENPKQRISVQLSSGNSAYLLKLEGFQNQLIDIELVDILGRKTTLTRDHRVLYSPEYVNIPMLPSRIGMGFYLLQVKNPTSTYCLKVY